MKKNNNDLEVNEIVKNYFVNFPQNTQLSLAIIDKGEIKYYGYKKNNNVAVINNEESVFGIGSISKVLSATVLADAVVHDNLDVKSRVEDFYTFPFDRSIDDSLENLANHSSGFMSRDTSFEANVDSLREYYAKFDEDLMIDTLKTLSLYNDDIYGKYSYSNFGFGLLGYTLSQKYGIPFKNLLKDKVFDKYNMINTSTDIKGVNNIIVEGLDKDGIETKNWDMNMLLAAGGVYSCVKGLASYVKAHFDENNKALELMRKPTLIVDSEMKVGLGIHIVKGSNNREVFWHNGGGGGYKSAMEFNVETKSAVIILSNVSYFNPNHWDIDRICTNLMNRLIDKNIDPN